MAKPIKASKLDAPVLGVFEGECADADITNENGLDITRDVWTTVFNSELYKQGIDLGWYIGYLGHPDDPNCMEFKDACIVMTEGHIEDDGKVYGKFNLIDTPVGRVVKTFIDAGVTFGISVRGAGDIVNNSVDPDSFVFRGFDLVTFPAYREAIPDFQAIAASTDSDTRKKYQKICASVETELNDITSCDALETIQAQFPEQSETYNSIQDRINELNELDAAETEAEDIMNNPVDCDDIGGIKLQAMIKLYLEEKKRADDLAAQLSAMHSSMSAQLVTMSTKVSSLMRIVATQSTTVDEIKADYDKKSKQLIAKNRLAIKANKRIKSQLEKLQADNLGYKQKIEANTKVIAEKDSELKRVKSQLTETVSNDEETANRLSDLENEVKMSNRKVEAASKLVEEYQDAYATLYAQALGVDLGGVSVTASTSVKDLQQKIVGSKSLPDDSLTIDEPEEVDFESFDDSDIVTI